MRREQKKSKQRTKTEKRREKQKGKWRETKRQKVEVNGNGKEEKGTKKPEKQIKIPVDSQLKYFTLDGKSIFSIGLKETERVLNFFKLFIFFEIFVILLRLIENVFNFEKWVISFGIFVRELSLRYRERGEEKQAWTRSEIIRGN